MSSEEWSLEQPSRTRSLRRRSRCGFGPEYSGIARNGETILRESQYARSYGCAIKGRLARCSAIDQSIPYRTERSQSGRWIFGRRDGVTTVSSESRLSKSGSIAVSQKLLSSPGSGRVRNLSCARKERDLSKQAGSVNWPKRGRYSEWGFVG